MRENEWVYTVLVLKKDSTLGFTEELLHTVLRPEAVVGSLLVAIPWEWKVG